MRRWVGVLVVAGLAAGCGSTVNVAQEKETLMRLDREWSATVKDTDRFLSYFAPDASVYATGMPVVTGAANIRQMWTEMSSSPGFSLSFEPSKADVAASGDIGYTTGTYNSTMAGVKEAGKYVTAWKKQADGQWKVMEDIFNADSAPTGGQAAAHVFFDASAIKWIDPPPSLPPGAKMAVVSGDPSQPGPFVIRAQVPAGYKVPPHWHPGVENLTILSGTVAIGMGETWNDSGLQALPAGSFASLPAEMRHFFLARTAATFQVHGMGPFVLNYVNPADDPRTAKQ